MGLDGVELVMAVEEAFGITIQDQQAEKVRTPRNLIQVVMEQLGQTDIAAGASGPCLTHRAFDQLRAILIEEAPALRCDITPRTRVDTLIARQGRAERLKQIAELAGISAFPQLVRPKWVNVLNGCIFLGIFALLTFGLRQGSLSWGTASLFGFIAGLISLTIANVATEPLRLELSPAYATVGDLARWVMAHKPNLASAEPGPLKWTREQVAALVRDIVIEQLGCEKNYREDAGFVEELGLS